MKKERGALSLIKKKSVCFVLRPDQTIREHVLIQLSNNVLGTNVAVWKRERRTFQIILGLTRQSRLALGRSQACCCCSNLFLWNMSTAGWKYLTKQFIQMWAQLGENVLQSVHLNMKSWIERDDILPCTLSTIITQDMLTYSHTSANNKITGWFGKSLRQKGFPFWRSSIRNILERDDHLSTRTPPHSDLVRWPPRPDPHPQKWAQNHFFRVSNGPQTHRMCHLKYILSLSDVSGPAFHEASSH